jgi:hypothetical protein
MATLEEFMAALEVTAAIQPVKVNVKGWPELYVRPVTVDEAEQQAEDMQDKNNRHGGLSRAAARVICNADGKIIGDWRDPKYVAALGRQPWPKLQKLLAAANEEDDAAGN